MFEEFVVRYGYISVFLGTLLEGETFILIGGFLAHRGYLAFHLVAGAAALGAFVGDMAYFFVGRRYGRSLLQRSRRAREILPWLDRVMKRYHVLWIFLVRYLYGARWLAAVAAGSSRMSPWRFALWTLPACALWALLGSGAGFLAGEAIRRLLGDVRRYELASLAIVAALGLLYGAFVLWEERRLSRKADSG